MKAYVASCIIGVFAFDKDKNILTYRLFDKDVDKIADKLKDTELTAEEKEVLDDLLKAGYKEVEVEKDLGENYFNGLSVKTEKDNLASNILKESFRKLAIDLQFVEDQAELNQLLTKVNVALTREKLAKPKKDKVIMAVIGVIDELDKSSNNFVERLRELYGHHSPEIVKAVPNNEKFAELVAKYGHRDDMREVKVKTSSGMDFQKHDILAVQQLAATINQMYKTRDDMNKYLEKICQEAIPNLTAIVGAAIAGRLLQLAGGLDKIARMPSSTIQLLGAEKALFRHLKEGGRPPKFGVLFAHQYIQNARKEDKGKVARLIAAKLTFAARIDAYSDRNDGARMKKELEEEVKKL